MNGVVVVGVDCGRLSSRTFCHFLLRCDVFIMLGCLASCCSPMSERPQGRKVPFELTHEVALAKTPEPEEMVYDRQ